MASPTITISPRAVKKVTRVYVAPNPNFASGGALDYDEDGDMDDGDASKKKERACNLKVGTMQ